ncbi:MAG: kelch repeat-containing protein [Polyangiaceae bacterium]
MVRPPVSLSLLCGAVIAIASAGGCSEDGTASTPLDAAARIVRNDKDTSLALAPSRTNGFAEDTDGFASLGLRRARAGIFTDLASALPAQANGDVVLGPGNVSSFRMTVSPVGARAVRGELSEGRVVYPAAFDDVDEIAVSTESASEFFYLLRSEGAPHAFEWVLDLPKGIASVERRADGLWFLDEKRAFVLRVPLAYAIDSSGKKFQADLAWDGANHKLSVHLDKSAQYTYPVLLDPTFETRIWSELKAPVDLAHPSMAYDVARRNSVVFAVDQTWTWDGATWSAYVAPRGGVTPSLRYAGRLAYDEARKNTVLFGGTYGNRVFGETWLWNGTEWATTRPSASPAGRYFPAMVYDRTRSEVVLFGGATLNGALQDTWVWDGTTWINKAPSVKPSARYDAGFAYDTVRGKALLFGGVGSSGILGDTWEWNGQVWQKLTLAESPSPRYGAFVTFDESRKQTLLYGGQTESGISPDTWAFDGVAWKRLTPGLSPPAAFDTTGAYDPIRQNVQLFGGSLEDRPHNGTWTWDGRVWRQELNGDLPEVRNDKTPLYANEAKQELQLFQGVDNIDDPKSTGWAFNGLAWARRAFRATPEKRRAPAIVWDEARQNAVMFGGAGDSQLLSDTWIFSGGWAATTPTNSPPARSQHRLAYHAPSQTVVLFGGSNETGLLNDTWTWNGTNWTARLVANPPPARVRAGMTMHPGSGKVVLFGGYDDNGVRNDTWTWDGVSWKEERPAKTPDANIGNLLVSNDKDCFLIQTKGTLWQWDGRDWGLLQEVETPEWDPNKWGAEGIYDPATKNFLIIGPSKSYRGSPSEGFKQVGAEGYVFGGVLASDGKTAMRVSLDQSDDLWRADQTFVMVNKDEKNGDWAPLAIVDAVPEVVVGSMYDPGRKVGILMGREHQGAFRTWTWDGAALRSNGTYGVLGNRENFALAFDRARGQGVLFGGSVDGQGSSSSTFVLNGADWSEVAPNNAPPGRSVATMAFDSARNNVVLFGGSNGSAFLNDTWTWDGTDWTKRQPLTLPPGREAAALDFNPQTGTVILFGGYNESGTLADTWSWNGTDWTQIVTKTPPTSRANHALAYLSTAKRTILFGGASTRPVAVRSPWAFYSRGGSCTSASDCATGSCVDGVCCEVAACGTCQTCAGTDPGKCTSIVNAEDPDTCAAANHVSCNEKGVCGPSLGGGCASGADCGSGLCIDGVCCDSACDRPCESCRAAEKISGRDDGRCGAAIAGTNPGGKCAGKATCSATGVCSQTTGTACRNGRYLENAAGGSKDCSPYRCEGQCLTRCSSANDCVFPFTCSVDGTCVSPGTPTSDADGCSMHPSTDSSSTPSTVLVVGAALAFARRLRRKKGGTSLRA